MLNLQIAVIIALQARRVHLKKCATKYKVPPSTVTDLVRRQQTELNSRLPNEQLAEYHFSKSILVTFGFFYHCSLLFSAVCIREIFKMKALDGIYVRTGSLLN